MAICIVCITIPGFPTLPGTSWKPGILSFTFPGLENACNLHKKWRKPGNVTHNLEQNFKLVNLVFQDFLFKMSFTKNIIYIFVICIYIININTYSEPNCPTISLLLPGNNLENTQTFVSPEKWEPCILALIMLCSSHYAQTYYTSCCDGFLHPWQLRGHP